MEEMLWWESDGEKYRLMRERKLKDKLIGSKWDVIDS
jgi:hypothetical protein